MVSPLRPVVAPGKKISQEQPNPSVRFPLNDCAQKAAAHILSRRIGGAWRDHHARLLRTHPPDTPLRLLGTTPRGLARMLTESGLPARALRRAPREALTPGALACVELRALTGRGPPRLHWIELTPEHLADPRLERAWECRASPLPMHRRALVVLDDDAHRGSERNAFPS